MNGREYKKVLYGGSALISQELIIIEDEHARIK